MSPKTSKETKNHVIFLARDCFRSFGPDDLRVLRLDYNKLLIDCVSRLSVKKVLKHPCNDEHILISVRAYKISLSSD